MMRRSLVLLFAITSTMVAQALTVGNLKTQAMKNPVGIDISTPLFSWILESNQRGTMQQSYSISVATDKDFSNVAWESGEVESDQSVDVEAKGLTLKACTRYYWRVTVKDNKGGQTTSTERAYFETGLMKASAWGATKWIKATQNAKGTSSGASEEITDYEVEVKFQIQSLAAGVIFAASDHNNYYMWQVSTNGSLRFRPHRWTNGSAACLSENAITGVSVKNGEEHTLKIVVTGAKTATTYIDGVKVDSRTGDFKYGDFGFREDYDNGSTPEEAYFDDFRVTSNGKTLLSEDFETNDPIFSTGTVQNGRFHLKGAGAYAWQMKIGKKVHFDVEADMTLMNDNASICFSATNANRYMMWAINTFELSTPVVRRHVYNNSGTPIYSDTKIPFAKEEIIGKPHHIRIECATPYVRTYIDDKLVDTYRDDNGVLDIGDLGFRVSATGREREKAYFDNLRMTVYDADGNGTVTVNEDFEGQSSIFDNADIRTYGGSKQIYMESAAGSSKRLMQSEGSVLPGAPMVRKEFALKGGIQKARLYSSGLGIYNAYVNGQRVGLYDADSDRDFDPDYDYDELKPGSTDYKKTVFYTTHDITSLVHEGQNAIGAEVTSGWWSGGIAHGEFGNCDCAFRGMIVVTYEDGTEDKIVSDLTWSSNTNGALRKGDIYNGETYDARRESDWTKPGFDDSDWFAVAENNDFKGSILAFEGPRVRAVKSLARLPQKTYIYEGIRNTGTAYGMLKQVNTYSGDQPVELKAGQTAIYDLGQNAAGWVTFTAKGAPGTRLRFRFSEMCNETGDINRGDDGPGGSLYLINLRSAEASLYYTMKGSEEGEHFHPTTTYYGFRFIEVTTSADVTLEKVVGETVTSAVDENSAFHCSHDAVNQLYSNIMWGQRSNFVSVPTDCPQRDERLGWAADTQVYCLAGLYNGDTRSFYEKWMRDMRDSQRSDGAYPHVAPYSWGVGHGAAAWADAGIIVPWKVYLMTGDKQIVKDNWASMEKYMNWMATQTQDGYQYNGGTTTYGDWVSFVNTDSRYCSVSYYAYIAQLMAKMASVLSTRSSDTYARKAKTYNTLFENIKKEWQKRYLNSSGIPNINTQCAYLMALRYNLLPDEASITRTKNALRTAIINNGDKLNTGFLGTAILNQTLTQYGLNDEAYTLLLQRECPSWLYSVDQGATTVWERWNSYTKEGGFHKDISMNSFNHYAYGAVSDWMFGQMAGIAPDEAIPGFKHIILKPNPDTRRALKHSQKRITNVDASVWTPYGYAKGAWTCAAGNADMTYDVTVPANATATLYMPCADGKMVLESGEDAAKVEGIEYVETKDGLAIFNLGSGSYRFTIADGTQNAISQPTATVNTVHSLYNLQGMSLGADADVHSGVYIRDGKKVLMK